MGGAEKLAFLVVIPSFHTQIQHVHTTTETISYGRAGNRQISREKGHLSYPAGAIVTVFAKAVGGDTELWEAEVGKTSEAHV